MPTPKAPPLKILYASQNILRLSQNILRIAKYFTLTLKTRPKSHWCIKLPADTRYPLANDS